MHMCAAVKDESGQYQLNGHLVVENGRAEIIRDMAGSKFKYKMLDNSRDYLYSLGPLHDSLIIQVCLSTSFPNIRCDINWPCCLIIDQLINDRSIFFTARRFARAVYAVIVCLSVRPSVISRCPTKTAKRRITQITPYNSTWTVVYWRQKKISAKCKGVTPTSLPRGALYRWGRLKSVIFDQYLAYLRNRAI